MSENPLAILARWVQRGNPSDEVIEQRLTELMAASAGSPPDGLTVEETTAIMAALKRGPVSREDAILAESLSRVLFKRQYRGEVRPVVLTRRDNMAAAERLRQRSYAGLKSLDDDMKATTNLIASVEREEPELRRQMKAALLVPEIRLDWLSSAKWAACGYPTVVMGHKYAAALMATSLTDQVYDVLHLPFPSFTIDVPTGLLTCDGTDAMPGVFEIYRIVVARFADIATEREPLFWYIAHSDGPQLHRHAPDMRNLVGTDQDGHVETTAEHDMPFAFGLSELTARDDRCHVLIGRLIGGVCLAMSDPAHVLDRPSSTKHAKRRRQEKRGAAPALPELAVYRIGKPINLDCRQEVRDYLDGKRRTSPSVRVLVRGHWKRQHYGPRRELVKAIWLEPYFRGPEAGALNVRPHVLAR